MGREHTRIFYKTCVINYRYKQHWSNNPLLKKFRLFHLSSCDIIFFGGVENQKSHSGELPSSQTAEVLAGFIFWMFVDPCIIVQFLQKNPTRCNSVSKFYYSIFKWSSTCFRRYTAYHQEPKTEQAASGFA
jgi:hypothetical protein